MKLKLKQNICWRKFFPLLSYFTYNETMKDHFSLQRSLKNIPKSFRKSELVVLRMPCEIMIFLYRNLPTNGNGAGRISIIWESHNLACHLGKQLLKMIFSSKDIFSKLFSFSALWSTLSFK